jgi:hypothetical protein
LAELFVATLLIVPITLTFAFLAMFLGAVMVDRRAATASVTALAVASYFLNYLAQIVDSLRPLAWASPFRYYDFEALAEGVDWWRTAVLLGVAATLSIATLANFEKRDIGAGSTVNWRAWLVGLVSRKAQAS